MTPQLAATAWTSAGDVSPCTHRRSARCPSPNGSFDLPGLVATVRGLGFDGPWGVEILSTSFRKLLVDEARKLAADSALTAL